MQKLLSIFVYLVLLVFLESAAQVTGVTASAPAEIPAGEPRYVALTFDDGPPSGRIAGAGGQRYVFSGGGTAGGE